jgi:hypothetical protein
MYAVHRVLVVMPLAAGTTTRWQLKKSTDDGEGVWCHTHAQIQAQ